MTEVSGGSTVRGVDLFRGGSVGVAESMIAGVQTVAAVRALIGGEGEGEAPTAMATDGHVTGGAGAGAGAESVLAHTGGNSDYFFRPERPTRL